MKFALSAIADYVHQSLRFDLVAGFTVAMIAVPQAMAYAAIAGMPPICGLFTAIIAACDGRVSLR